MEFPRFHPLLLVDIFVCLLVVVGGGDGGPVCISGSISLSCRIDERQKVDRTKHRLV